MPGWSVDEINRVHLGLHGRLEEAILDEDEAADVETAIGRMIDSLPGDANRDSVLAEIGEMVDRHYERRRKRRFPR